MNHLYWSAVAALITLNYSLVMEAVCGLFKSIPGQDACPSMEIPNPLYGTLATVFVYGLVACGFRAYRDFYRGDFLWERPGD
jgi:hypothetical protein